MFDKLLHGELQKKSPARGWGVKMLGLLIFETKTHPVTVDITIEQRIRFPLDTSNAAVNCFRSAEL